MTETIVSPKAALARLREGNERFVANLRSVDVMPTRARREALAGGQAPFAIILSCADSRVPAELLFDQGLGDLFVIRVAGNVVDPSLLGSVEYAAAELGTQLAVVLGHSSCGAVKAAAKHLCEDAPLPSPNITDIVERIRPGIADHCPKGGRVDEIMPRAVRANVEHSVRKLLADSPLLQGRVDQGELQVVGAEYDLVSGSVAFLDSPS